LLLDGRLGSGQRVVIGVRDGDLDLDVEDVRDAAAAQA
jgi:ATP-dependent Clp protease ATP-binding subunit ClpC